MTQEFQEGDTRGSMTFYAPAENVNNSITWRVEGEEVIKISEGKFYWKGEEVEDVHNVYERFNEWLTRAEKTT